MDSSNVTAYYQSCNSTSTVEHGKSIRGERSSPVDLSPDFPDLVLIINPFGTYLPRLRWNRTGNRESRELNVCCPPTNYLPKERKPRSTFEYFKMSRSHVSSHFQCSFRLQFFYFHFRLFLRSGNKILMAFLYFYDIGKEIILQWLINDVWLYSYREKVIIF